MDQDNKKYGSYSFTLQKLSESFLYVLLSWFLKWVGDHLAIIYFLGQKW